MFFDGCELIAVGIIVRPHGLKGHLGIKLHNNFSDEILEIGQPVFLIYEGLPVPYFIEEIKHTSLTIIKLRFIENEETSLRFINSQLFVKADDLDEKHEFDITETSALNEFQGFDVFDVNYGFIGIIINFNEIPGNIIFETEFNGKNILIPWNDKIVVEINVDMRRISVNTPEGLIDLYLS